MDGLFQISMAENLDTKSFLLNKIWLRILRALCWIAEFRARPRRVAYVDSESDVERARADWSCGTESARIAVLRSDWRPRRKGRLSGSSEFGEETDGD